MNYNLKDIPILIPAKGKSVRCPGKNKALLPYIAKYLHNEKLEGTVLSNDQNIRSLAELYGLKSWVEHRTDKDDDLSACRKFMKNCDREMFFMLPLTQPFKHKGLLKEMFDKLDDDTDFIVTSHITSDRSLFYAKDNKFITPSKERKGCMCPDVETIDGTAYLIKKSFIEKVASNEDFWGGKFKTSINKAPFIDIDTEEDMEKFKFLVNLS